MALFFWFEQLFVSRVGFTTLTNKRMKSTLLNKSCSNIKKIMPLCYTSFKSFSNKISDIFIRATFICGLCLDCEVLVKIAVWILRWFLSHQTGFSDCTGSCLKETVPFQGSFTKNLIPSNCMYYHVSFCIPKSFERVAYDYLKFCC